MCVEYSGELLQRKRTAIAKRDADLLTGNTKKSKSIEL